MKVEPVSLLSATKLPIEPADDEVKSKLPRSQSSMDQESDAAQSPPEHSSDDHDESGSGDNHAQQVAPEATFHIHQDLNNFAAK